MRLNFRRCGYLLGAIVFASLSIPVIAQDSSTATVATVNGEKISQKEFYQRLQYLSGVGTLENQRFIEAPPGLIALDRIISERLILQLAAKESVTPTDDQVDQSIRLALSDNPNLKINWIASGRSEDDFRHQFLIKDAKFNLITKGVIVTEQEIKTKYTTQPDLYTIPKLVHLRVITVDKKEDEAAVDTELSTGKSFSDVAKELSVDITKTQGGDFGNIPESSLSPAIKTALAGIKIGESSDWIPTKTGFLKAFFENATAEKKLPLDDKLTEQIREELMEERGTVKNDLIQEIKDMQKTADISIVNPAFDKAYKTMRSQAMPTSK